MTLNYWMIVESKLNGVVGSSITNPEIISLLERKTSQVVKRLLFFKKIIIYLYIHSLGHGFTTLQVRTCQPKAITLLQFYYAPFPPDFS